MPVQAPPGETAPSRPLPEGFLPSNCNYAEQDWPLLARQWFPLCRADAALAKPRQVMLLNLRLVVYRTPNGIHVGRDMCPHRGLPLSSGRVEGDELVCAYHGLRFGSNGQCRKAAEKLALKTADCFRMTMFPSIETHGFIWTCLIPSEEIPVIELNCNSTNEQELEPSYLFRLSEDFFIAMLKLFISPESTAAESGEHQSIWNLALEEYRRLILEISSNNEKDSAQQSSG